MTKCISEILVGGGQLHQVKSAVRKIAFSKGGVA